MVLEKLGGSLREALRKIAGASYIDESLIKEIVRDIQRALIQADVNVQLALTITKQLQRRALEEKPPPGMSPREHVVRIIYEELGYILGTAREVLPEEGPVRRPRRRGRAPARGVRSAEAARGTDQRAVLRGSGRERRREDRQGRGEGARRDGRHHRGLVRSARPRTRLDRGN